MQKRLKPTAKSVCPRISTVCMTWINTIRKTTNHNHCRLTIAPYNTCDLIEINRLYSEWVSFRIITHNQQTDIFITYFKTDVCLDNFIFYVSLFLAFLQHILYLAFSLGKRHLITNCPLVNMKYSETCSGLTFAMSIKIIELFHFDLAKHWPLTSSQYIWKSFISAI